MSNTTETPTPDTGRKVRRRRILTAAGAVVVIGGLAAGVPALAAGPDLPSLTAQQLLEKALQSDVQTFSGTVKTSVDLGLPSQALSALPSAAASAAKRGGSQADQQGAAQAQQALLALLTGPQSVSVAVDGHERQRVSTTVSGDTVDLIHNGTQAWAYDSKQNSVLHLTGLRTGQQSDAQKQLTTPQQAAAQVLKQLGQYSDVSVSGTSKVAGRSVYELIVRPKGNGSTIGDVRIGIDSGTGMPLEVKVNPADGSDPIADVRFSSISFSAPAPGTFDYTAPAGAKVTTRQAPADKPGTDRRPGAAKKVPGPTLKQQNDTTVLGSGWTTVVKWAPQSGAAGKNDTSALSLVKSFGKAVPGGTLVSTKVVNVLVTDQGTVYAGAVTPAFLENLAK
ncbi:LolA family protein [Streptacidiphilus monticola]|uniref:Outer membrane lipoprotein carrier protein LolA n=1 Tax=Streptacidiphilus monticola TaxID=2161674 RepID=A0ABW1FT24_9ACTN